uniref:Galectin n=1 Tax=Panagrellus redivivus TaxID=6233 RepID=A0A7E4VSF3_PANRE
MQHAKGEQLVNLTFDDGNLYFNDEFFFKIHFWISRRHDRAELYIKRKQRGFALWGEAEGERRLTIGNGPWGKPKHEWLNLTLDGRPCWEVKAKVVVGFIKFTVNRHWTGFPTKPYDDTFFETTTTTTTTVAKDTANVSEEDENHKESETTQQPTVNKASTMQGLMYAVCGILVLIAATLLFFLGFRFGRCFARKRALKNGLLKTGVKESNASEPGSDTGVITPDASTNPADSTKMPTKAVASIPTAKTNTEKNPVHAKSAKPTPITPTTKDEVESSTVPTEPQLISNKSNRTV